MRSTSDIWCRVFRRSFYDSLFDLMLSGRNPCFDFNACNSERFTTMPLTIHHHAASSILLWVSTACCIERLDACMSDDTLYSHNPTDHRHHM